MIKTKINYNKDLLDSIIKKDKADLVGSYTKLTRNINIKFKCKCGNYYEKKFRSLNEYGGANCNFCTKKNSLYKIKQTNISKYGVENTFQSEEIKNKIKQTNLTKYGVENTFQSEEIKNKIKQTNLIKYGVEYSFQSEEIKNKIKQTNLGRYGVENVMFNKDILEKHFKNSYKLKDYKLPSGKTIKIQGYEYIALDELLKIYEENDIIVGNLNMMPELWWNDSKNIKHRYYVDIFIPKENKMIEVKSNWTYLQDDKKEKIEKIPLEAKKLGYKYEYWIYDEKKNKEIIYF
jgi:hypothetical protein